MFGWRKGHVVTTMVEEYIEKAEHCLGAFKIAFDTYTNRGLCEPFDSLVDKTHMAESSCDDIRRRIEEALYAKALIPESRGDILNLLEAVDRVPNTADGVLHDIQDQLLEIPEEMKGKFTQLVHVNCDCFADLTKAFRLLFTEPEQIHQLTDALDKKESSADHLERDMIRAVFTNPTIAPDQRILLRDLIRQICNISDRAENAADTLHIVVVKRLV